MVIDFKGKIEEVKTGKIYNKFGLGSNPFSATPSDIKETFVNREKELEKFIRIIYDLVKLRTPHIPILGNHGIGKTHFIQYVYELVKENKSSLGIKKVLYVKGAKGFGDIKQKENGIVYFIDDLDILTLHDISNASVFYEENAGKIIGTWNFRAWKNCNRKIDFKIPKAEPLTLHKLDDKNLMSILKKRLDLNKKDKDLMESFFPDSILNIITFASQGNPNHLIAIARQYLDLLFNDEITSVTEEVIHKFTDILKLRSIKDTHKNVESLTPKQKIVLRKIIDLEEVSASKLAEIFDFSRAAAVQFLKALEDKDLLERRIKDQTACYYVHSEIVDEIDEKLESLE